MRICHQAVINTAAFDRWTNVNSLDIVIYDKANSKNTDVKNYISKLPQLKPDSPFQ